MLMKSYFFATALGVALIGGCANENRAPISGQTTVENDNMRASRGATGYETGSATDNSGTATETQKKARGSSETGNIDGGGSGARSSTD